MRPIPPRSLFEPVVAGVKCGVTSERATYSPCFSNAPRPIPPLPEPVRDLFPLPVGGRCDPFPCPIRALRPIPPVNRDLIHLRGVHTRDLFPRHSRSNLTGLSTRDLFPLLPNESRPIPPTTVCWARTTPRVNSRRPYVRVFNRPLTFIGKVLSHSLSSLAARDGLLLLARPIPPKLGLTRDLLSHACERRQIHPRQGRTTCDPFPCRGALSDRAL